MAMMNALAPVDTAAARQRGTRNALSEMKARGMANTLNRDQAVRQTGQQAAQGGYSTEEHANALRKQGYTQAANRLTRQEQQTQSGRITNAAQGVEVIARTAPLARDQRSWDRVRQFWQDKGIAEPGELPDEFDPELVQVLSGNAKKQLSSSDLVEVQGPDGPMFVPADMAPGMTPAGQQADFDQVNVALPGGERVRGRKGPGGSLQIIDDQGRWVEAPREAQRVGVSLSGSEQDLGLARPPQTGEFQEAEQEDGESVYESVEEGTGPGSQVRAGVNAVFGPFMEGTPFRDTARARSAVRNFNQTAKQALVNSDRFPVYEQKIVQQLLPDPDRFFNDPDAEREKLDELRNFVESKKEQNRRSMQSGNVTRDEYGSLSNRNETLDRILGLMGQPEQESQGQYTMDSPAQPTTREEYDQLPSGAYFRDDEGLKRKP